MADFPTVVPTHTSDDSPNPEDVDWENPEACPFCGEQLADCDVGFVDHADADSDCNARLEEWRENVAGDVGGGWTG